jgi:energy-converting hydrogenase B subunit D
VSVLQAVAFVAVLLGGTAAALVADPLRQTFAIGVYGLALTALFFALQAPDVGLSEIVVSSLGLPLIVIAALRKIRQQERSSRGREHKR